MPAFDMIDPSDPLVAGGIIALALVAGIAIASLATKLFTTWAESTEFKLDNLLIRHLKGPLHLLAPIALLFVAARYMAPGLAESAVFDTSFKVLAILFTAWLAIRIINVTSEHLYSRFNVNVRDNLRARRVHTQITVVRRLLVFIVTVLAIGSFFLMFEQLRGLGLSLLASAGIAGVIIGFAAQKLLGNLLAGIQIALTQPIRLDDVVVVEGEWGWIEEITLTYVVVRVWDRRRLVLPISYFIEHPFQNWTRKSADILGTVYLHTDYTVPVEAVRAKLSEILASTELWDGEVGLVQVTGAGADTLELRALVSAADSPTAWDLRCLVREKLVDFIRSEYPDALPKTRAVVEKS